MENLCLKNGHLAPGLSHGWGYPSAARIELNRSRPETYQKLTRGTMKRTFVRLMQLSVAACYVGKCRQFPRLCNEYSESRRYSARAGIQRQRCATCLRRTSDRAHSIWQKSPHCRPGPTGLLTRSYVQGLPFAFVSKKDGHLRSKSATSTQKMRTIRCARLCWRSTRPASLYCWLALFCKPCSVC